VATGHNLVSEEATSYVEGELEENAPEEVTTVCRTDPGNIEWVIRLKGGNEYREGTKPPPLSPDERNQLEQEIRDFLAIEDPIEDAENPWEDIVNEVELLTLDDGEEFDPMVPSDSSDE